MINVNFLQPNSNESWKNFSLFSFLKARVDAELLMQIKGDFYTEIISFSIVTPQTDGRKKKTWRQLKIQVLVIKYRIHLIDVLPC